MSPPEVCDTIGYERFDRDDDSPRSPRELPGMRLIAREGDGNVLPNVPPDRTGRIPQRHVDGQQQADRLYQQTR